MIFKELRHRKTGTGREGKDDIERLFTFKILET